MGRLTELRWGTDRTVSKGAQPWKPVGAQLNRSTLVELFFDLAFVLVLTQLSRYLEQHLTWFGWAQTVVLTSAVWWVWTMVTWICDVYATTDPRMQVLITVLTFGVIAMAVAIPNTFGRHGLIFAGAYVSIQLARNTALLLAGLRTATTRLPLRMVLWTLATAPLWILGGALHNSSQTVLWVVAIAIDCTGAFVGWPAPRLGRLHPDQWEASGEHLAERYRQILLISIGDAILTMGAAWIDTPATPLRGAALAVAFLYIVLLWQAYFRVAGEQLAEMISRSRHKGVVAELSIACHLIMILGMVVSALAIDIIIRHPLAHPRGYWAAVVILGPALFLFGRILFGFLVLGRLSPSRMIALIGLLAIIPLGVVLAPIFRALLVTAILSIVQAPRITKRAARMIHEPVLENE
jgi:low temperature requirement protein LtrA